jgi:hypothetical protein
VANTNNTIKNAASVIAKAAAQELADNLKFCKTIDQADESDFDGKNGYKAGDTITISVPARYVPQNTMDITSSIQDNVEEKVSLTLDTISTIGMQFGTTEIATEVGLKSTLKRYVIPAAQSIAQNVEQRFLLKATQGVYNVTGTAGSNAFTVADIQAGKVKLDQALAPMADRNFLMNSASGAAAVIDRKGLFQSSEEISKQYKEGYVGTADSFNWLQNELIYTHTNGNDVTGVTVNATASEGATTLALTGVTATTGTIKKGSVFTVAGVFKVHPITKQAYSVLQQFVVTADATANGSGVATVSVSPTIYAGSAGRQNVSALPASTAAVTFVGTESVSYAQNLMYVPQAFRMASVPLEMPENAEFAAQETVDGITVAIIRDFDVLQRRWITRLDFLGGLAIVRPEWANRVTA